MAASVGLTKLLCKVSSTVGFYVSRYASRLSSTLLPLQSPKLITADVNTYIT